MASLNLKADNSFHKHPESHVKKLQIICGAHTIGKSDINEDAYFYLDRGFGVADGVSGWNDFGFSSEAFSNQLMNNCKTEIESFDKQTS